MAGLDSNLTCADQRPRRRMPPMLRRAPSPIRREPRANYRPLPQRNVAKHPFRPVWPQQLLMEPHVALRNPLGCGLSPYHENSCGVWAIITMLLLYAADATTEDWEALQ